MRKNIFLAAGLLISLAVATLTGAAWWYEDILAGSERSVLVLDKNTQNEKFGKFSHVTGRLKWLPDEFVSYISQPWLKMTLERTYVDKNYDGILAMTSEKDKKLGRIERFIRGNTLFRTAQAEKNTKKIPAILKDAVGQYDGVLRTEADFDSAFNKELLLRILNGQAPLKEKPKEKDKGDQSGDKPGGEGSDPGGKDPQGQSVHGQKGKPLKGQNMDKFETHIPIGDEEGEKDDGAAAGVRRKRRG